MRQKKIDTHRSEIISSLNDAKKKLFTHEDMKHFFSEAKEKWELPISLKFRNFTDYLLSNSKLIEHSLTFSNKNVTRYSLGKMSPYAIVKSIGRDAYFTHRTAMYINKLIHDDPPDVYLNIEQRPNPSQDRRLEQGRIDLAFSRNVRQSKNIATFDGKKIHLLNGMYTDNLGVHKTRWQGGTIRTTDVERTLIDIAVRPIYSGGVNEVGRAYRNAREKVSVKKLANTLAKLDYVYPYHQVVGFYLDEAGVYDRSEVEIFCRFGLRYDFYLTHKMHKTLFSPEWRLHYPADFRI